MLVREKFRLMMTNHKLLARDDLLQAYNMSDVVLYLRGIHCYEITGHCVCKYASINQLSLLLGLYRITIVRDRDRVA